MKPVHYSLMRLQNKDKAAYRRQEHRSVTESGQRKNRGGFQSLWGRVYFRGLGDPQTSLHSGDGER
jgi:hypothetical protein